MKTQKLVAILLILSLPCELAFGWEKLAHHVVSRTVGKLVRFHPIVLSQKAGFESQGKTMQLQAIDQMIEHFERTWLEMGHLGTIPEMYWDTLDKRELPTGYFRPEQFTEIPSPDSFFKLKVPLSLSESKALYQSKKKVEPFEEATGTLPWRIAQFTDLYKASLKEYPRALLCPQIKTQPHPSAYVTAYAAFLAHYIANASQPQLVTDHFSGLSTGQGGLVEYFGDALVNSLEWKLDQSVFKVALELYHADRPHAASVLKIHKTARESYPSMTPENRTVALSLALMADSYDQGAKAIEMDELYAMASYEEARLIPECAKYPHVAEVKRNWEKLGSEEKQKFARTKVRSTKEFPACRRPPRQSVTKTGEPAPTGMGEAVSNYFENLIIDRLAIAAALATDLVVGLWFETSMPALCPTHSTFLRPSYVSPGDPNCLGYLEKGAKKYSKSCLKD